MAESIEKSLPVTTNEFYLSAYRQDGQSVLATVLLQPEFRSKQQAYRFAAWLIEMAEILPDEELTSSFEEVRKAIRNT